MDGFFIFVQRLGVENDAAPHGKDNFVIVYSGGTDSDGKVHGVVKTDVTDGAGIDVPPVRFELVNDFHGSDLGTAGDRSPGKSGLKKINRISVPVESALDNRYQVIDILVGFQAFVLRHPDGSGLTDFADIVAQEIDDHGKLGIVFFALLQLPA